MQQDVVRARFKRIHSSVVFTRTRAHVCYTCRKLPFDEVMDGLSKGKVYVRGTGYINIVEMEKAAQGETVK